MLSGPYKIWFFEKIARFLKNGLLKIPRSSWSSNSKFMIFSYFWIFRVSKFQNESCLQLSVVFSVFIRSLRNTLAPWTVSGTAHWLVASGDGLLTTNEGPKLAYNTLDQPSWGNGDFRQFVNTTRVRTPPLRRSKRSCFQNWCNKAYYSRESCFRRPQFRNRWDTALLRRLGRADWWPGHNRHTGENSDFSRF